MSLMTYHLETYSIYTTSLTIDVAYMVSTWFDLLMVFEEGEEVRGRRPSREKDTRGCRLSWKKKLAYE